jgi:hypothetical protein
LADVAGFDEFYRGSRQRLLGYVFLLTGDLAEAQDVRIGDLISVLSPRAGTSAGDLRRIAATAAARLCAAADPPC